MEYPATNVVDPVESQYSLTEPYEGTVVHLYLDTLGLVTCGIGFLVPNKFALQTYAWTPELIDAEADYLVLLPRRSALAAIAEHAPRLRGREAPLNRSAIAVRLPVPGPCLFLEHAQLREPAPSHALA